MARKLSLSVLDQKYQNKPGTPVFAHLARVLLQEGKLDQAEEIAHAGVAVLPDYAFGHFVLANILARKEAYDAALKELEKALALDPWNPQGWKIYREIAKNAGIGEKEENATLNWHIADPFDLAGVDAFYPVEFSGDWMFSEEPEEQPAPEIEFTPPVEEEKVEEDHFAGLFAEGPSTEESEEEEAEDFEKALDDVFKETEPEADFTGFQLDMPEEEEEGEGETEETPSDEEMESDEESAFFSDDDFDSAIDSFLEEFGETEESEEAAEQVPGEEETEIKPEKFPAEEILEKAELTPEVEESPVPEDETSQEEEGGMIGFDDTAEEAEPDFPEEFIDEEPMDFSSVVADIISEREGESAEEPEAEDLEEAQKAESLEEVPPAEELKGEAPEEPAPSESELKAETGEDKIELAPEEEESPANKEENEAKPQFGRPPIVSPTLGEIYIAQGRFEEAIDIFRQLLKGDPENLRYQRKIKDLEDIIARTRSGEEGN
ncbi:MAG: hypothetical protein Kow0037_08100 [Calditrichia bacterium]